MENSTKELSLFKLTWPLFLELFLFMLMGLADTFMLSAVSDDAVAGVGTANQYIQIAILLLGVIGTGASIVVSQYLGSRLIAEASQIAALSVTLNLLVGLVISGLFILFSDVLMKMMNLQGAVLEAAQSYLVIVGGFIFVQALITSMSSIIRVQGWTKQTMYVSLAMNIVHVVLNYILIFGKFGMPELGVEGAAISSVVSRVLASVVFFWLLYQALEIRIEWADYYRLSKNYISKILKIGIPSALEQVLYQTNQIVLLYYVTFIGAEALSARQYAVNISMFTYLFAMAIGMATAILVGRYVGAGEKELAYSKVWFGVKSALIFTLSMVAIIILFREPFMRIFTDNEEIIQIGASVLLLSIFLETGRTINITIINSLRASGDAAYPVRIGFISMIVIGLSLGYLFVFVLDLGLVGVWLAIACDEWIRAVLVIFRWRSRKWERYAIVSSDK
ncbi:MAG: MATE family efflux transporter [Solibacillus sp.]|uniref:MATE family efflux transporter n=1 Tax=Solibacillus sp. TaxID=1909654 RepID=UPI0033150777